MANAAVSSDPEDVYYKTFAHLAKHYDGGRPRELTEICLAVGYGPIAVKDALDKMIGEGLAVAFRKEEDGSGGGGNYPKFKFAYNVWEYRRKHYWRGPSYEYYLDNPNEEMSTFKRMRFTCDVLGCILGWMKYERQLLTLKPPSKLLISEALAVMRDIKWKRTFFRYAYGKLPRPSPARKYKDISSFRRRLMKKMGDVKDTKNPRVFANYVELQQCHAYGSAAAFTYMKKKNEGFREMPRLEEYFKVI